MIRSNGGWFYTVRDGIKGDAAIEEARERLARAERDGVVPDPNDVYIGGIKTSYEREAGAT